MEPVNVDIEEATEFPDLSVEYSEFASEDGRILTMFAAASSAGHEPIPSAVRAGWNFISLYARDAEGNIVDAE